MTTASKGIDPEILSAVAREAAQQAIAAYRSRVRGGRPPILTEIDWEAVCQGIRDTKEKNSTLTLHACFLLWLKRSPHYGKESTDAIYKVAWDTIRREYGKRHPNNAQE